MVLGRVREAQGLLEEAERLLVDASKAIYRTGFNHHEEELALAEFCFRRGRMTEGDEWASKARASALRFGPESPVIGIVERRLKAAREVGAVAVAEAAEDAPSARG